MVCVHTWNHQMLEREGSLETLHSSSRITDENEAQKGQATRPDLMSSSWQNSGSRVSPALFHCNHLHLPELTWDQELLAQPWNSLGTPSSHLILYDVWALILFT